jgi:cobaltochelatase CobS
MASIKDLYNKDVIDAIVQSYSSDDPKEEDNGEPIIDPFTQIADAQFKRRKGERLFSTLFWKPKSIPNLPIRTFDPSDWDAEAALHIPDVDPMWVWNRQATEQFALAMYEGDTTLLHGLQGTGKSCLAEQWCALFQIPFWRMSCNRETRESHFLGSPAIEYNDEGQMCIKQEPTILTDSLRYGGLFCEDEAFRHNSALVLQSLREKNNRTVLLPDAPGRTSEERKLKAPIGRWWYVLTDNTSGSGDETGIFDAEVQDASTLDRIDAAIEVKYLGKPEERKILQKHSDLNIDIINGMLDVAKMVRAAFNKQTLMSTLSVRGLLSWASKTELMGNIGHGLQLSWYNKLGTDDKKVVEDIFHQVFGRKIND